jgi:predicted NUDIX family phosphoesterase
MQLNIKKYDCAGIYVLLRDNVIIGIYNTMDDANAAAKLKLKLNKEMEVDKEVEVDKEDEYYIVNE